MKLYNLALPLLCLTALGCRQEMADQPSYRPLAESNFFGDARSARPALPGTVARGQSEVDQALFTGQQGTAAEGITAPSVRTKVDDGIFPPLPGQPYVDEFPFEVTRDVLEEGRTRYNIYCMPCHDPTGEGGGVVVDRGFTRPPSYHNERLRKAPLGYLYAIASHGVGSMPDYSTQILPRQRWEIVAYVRALQQSQNTVVEELPAAARAAAQSKLSGPSAQQREQPRDQP